MLHCITLHCIIFHYVVLHCDRYEHLETKTNIFFIANNTVKHFISLYIYYISFHFVSQTWLSCSCSRSCCPHYFQICLKLSAIPFSSLHFFFLHRPLHTVICLPIIYHLLFISFVLSFIYLFIYLFVCLIGLTPMSIPVIQCLISILY